MRETDKLARRFTALASVWAALFVADVVALAIWPGEAILWLWLVLSGGSAAVWAREARRRQRRQRRQGERGGLWGTGKAGPE